MTVLRDIDQQVVRRDARVRRLLVAPGRNAAGVTPVLKPIEKFIAAHLANIHERESLASDRVERAHARAKRGCGLGGRIAQGQAEYHAWISRGTGLDSWRRRPPVHPAQIAENIPACPPACTIIKPSGQNLLTSSSPRPGSMPSPTP